MATDDNSTEGFSVYNHRACRGRFNGLQDENNLRNGGTGVKVPEPGGHRHEQRKSSYTASMSCI